MAQSELVGWGRVKIDDNSIIGGRETHGEGENLVLVANCDAGLFQTKSESLDMSNPCLHRFGGSLLESEEFAVEHKACHKACGLVHTFQNEPYNTWII